MLNAKGRKNLYRAAALALALPGLALGLVAGGVTGVPGAQAQMLVARANGRPITSFDVDMRMKLLRVLRLPGSRQDALESLIQDQLELDDTRKYQINPSDQDMLVSVNRDAVRLKTNPQALLSMIQRAGVSESHWHDHYKAKTAWLVYVHALNKDLEIGDAEVQAAKAKGGVRGGMTTDYTVEQVIFVVPQGASAGTAEARMREAQALRSRFTDCASGAALARGLPDVAVRDPVTRSASTLDTQLRDMLDHTAAGHLTNPQRTSEGVVMLAVCSKALAPNDSKADQDIRDTLLADKLDQEAAEKYKELRARAVVTTK